MTINGIYKGAMVQRFICDWPVGMHVIYRTRQRWRVEEVSKFYVERNEQLGVLRCRWESFQTVYWSNGDTWTMTAMVGKRGSCVRKRLCTWTFATYLRNTMDVDFIMFLCVCMWFLLCLCSYYPFVPFLHWGYLMMINWLIDWLIIRLIDWLMWIARKRKGTRRRKHLLQLAVMSGKRRWTSWEQQWTEDSNKWYSNTDDHYTGPIMNSSIGYSSWSAREEKGREVWQMYTIQVN